MIPALLALPLAEGAVGSIAGGLASAGNRILGSKPSFTQHLNNLTSKAQSIVNHFSSIGTMQSGQWSQMNGSDLQNWAQGLVGLHVDSTDISGNAISGVVSSIHQSNGATALEIGGHLVNLSQMKQISWSPSL